MLAGPVRGPNRIGHGLDIDGKPALIDRTLETHLEELGRTLKLNKILRADHGALIRIDSQTLCFYTMKTASANPTGI